MSADDGSDLQQALSLGGPITSTSSLSPIQLPPSHSSLNSLQRPPPSPTTPSPASESFNSTSTPLYLSQPFLPPLPFDPTLSASGGTVPTSTPTPTAGTATPTSKPFQTGSSQPTASTSQAPAMPMIQFDPRQSLSDDEDEDDDDDAGVPGRPKKRKSVANLRGAAAGQASGTPNKAGSAAADNDDEEKGRRKIQIEYIEEKSKRHITFSKRKAGIMKKAYELSTLTGTQVLLLVVSESGWVYTFTTDKFKPLVKEDENGNLSQGQKLIAACLEAKESTPNLDTYQTVASSAPSASFESNSAIHGGQIALKTRGGPVGGRPTATNRRVSSKGRNHIPTAIRTDGGHMPPVPQLPTPMSGYLDPALQSPLSPHGPRSRSHPPVSPNRVGMHHMQQQQMMGPGGNDYAEMLQRTDMLQMQGGPYDHGGGQWDPAMVYSSPPPTSHAPQHGSMIAMSQHDSHFQQQQQQRPYDPSQYDQMQQHYTNQQSSNDPMHQQSQRPMLHQPHSQQY